MLDVIALILTVIGGINWGLIGIFQFDLVAWLFGGHTRRHRRRMVHFPPVQGQ